MSEHTPLELLEEIERDTACRDEVAGLRAFLSRPEVMALSDPKLAAAAAVVIARLPELMEMAAAATPAPWKQGEDEDWDGDESGAVFNGMAPSLDVKGPDYLQEGYEYNGPVSDTVCVLGYSGHTAHIANLELIVATRNVLHEAAKASEAATPQGEQGER